MESHLPESVIGGRDLNAWKPDVVFVNLGDNDESFTVKQKQPFPVDFNDGYISLVRAIRAAYPKGAYRAGTPIFASCAAAFIKPATFFNGTNRARTPSLSGPVERACSGGLAPVSTPA